MKKDCFTGALGVVLFSCSYYMSSRLTQSAARWPKTISVLGLLLCLLLTVTNLLKLRRAGGGGKKESLFPMTGAQAARSGMVLGILTAWMLCLKPVGFLTSSVAALAAVFLVFEPRRTKRNVMRDVLAAAVFAAGMYALFHQLGVNFPSGLLL